MRLTKITLWNFRSYWSDDETCPSAEVSLAAGVNYLVGPNNVGKSNLLRAVGLALDPKAQPDSALDLPIGRKSKLGIDLHFQVGSEPSRAVSSLVRTVADYEEKFNLPVEARTAAKGSLRLHVRFLYGQRSASLQSPDVDPRKSLAKHRDALEAFHETVRFVDIHSGEDLETLLQRGFKEILASALGDEHGKAMKAAEEARTKYQEALGYVLRPVATHVRDRLGRYVRDIRDVDLRARLPPVGDALADAEVIVEDAISTTLEQKGTGVRGAMLLLLLSFIADSAKSAVVFGIEEPEAFLHPEAHRQLGEGLERFTQRADVSMIVTTHSPFLFRPDGSDERNAVFLVQKDETGKSSVKLDKDGFARADLFGSRALAALLDRAEEVPEKARLILLVEGHFDHAYLTLAALKLGISLDGIHIVKSNSASNAAMQAITMAARHVPGRVVVALFDRDESGLEGFDLLSNRFSWKKRGSDGLFVMTYESWVPSSERTVEAEDIFTNATMEAFLRMDEHKDHCDEKVRRKNGLYHYGLTEKGKKAFLAWLGAQEGPEAFEPWRRVIEHLRKLIR